MTELYSQSWLKKLGEAAENAAKRRVEQKVEQKAEEAVDKAFEAGKKKKKSSEEEEEEVVVKKKKAKKVVEEEEEVEEVEQEEAKPQPQVEKKPDIKSFEMAYAKSDFVAGDEIIFEDNLVDEQVGEFPSKWDIIQGNAEIAKIDGETVIAMYSEESWIIPLMKEPLNYLGDVFTVEFDVMSPYTSDEEASYAGYFDFRIQIADESWQDYKNHNVHFEWLSWPISETNKGQICTEWLTTRDAPSSNYSSDVVLRDNNWHHFAISFNKRALKVYYDGARIANVPNAKANNGWISFYNYAGRENQYVYLKNVRIAKGAVPLYDRMMSDGKFITYGITFDVGKSVIKPESMGEITRIVQLMNENPTLKFSVEGHTDATGNAASNQKLSEARAKAIVDKLVENGIAADRLTAVGKGQNTPIADNNTDEGRAKNRRVEFVKQ